MAESSVNRLLGILPHDFPRGRNGTFGKLEDQSQRSPGYQRFGQHEQEAPEAHVARAPHNLPSVTCIRTDKALNSNSRVETRMAPVMTHWSTT
jgi:hypothetical protein